MAYAKTVWEDRSVASPNTYTVTNNPDGTITLTPAPGTVVKAGTPVSAANMSKIENQLAAVDYELGTSGIWTFKKFADGTALCWGKMPISGIAVSTAWGGIYYGRSEGASFPFTFVAVPDVSCVYIPTDASVALVALGTTPILSTSNTGEIRFYRGATGTLSGNVDFIVVGKWK